MDTRDTIARVLVDILAVTATVITTTSDNIAHTNEIIYAVHDPSHHLIVREYRFRVPVDCFLPRNEGSSGHYYHGHVTIPPAHHVTGSTHHTVHHRFYTDSSFQHPKSLYGSKVGDTVYVKAFTDVRDYNQNRTDCYTTPTSSSYSSLKYFIIQNG
uniref:ZP-C domain-containing protein n=1 Tax=Magallana gigas TaxID=29159 RepID=A0A8W8IGP4_MAGGI